MTVLAAFLRTHQRIYEASRGAVGHRMIGAPTLLLRTTGRRTGKQRTTALVYAKDEDDSLVVVASNGGANNAPAWLHNLKQDHSIKVQIGRRNFAGKAEVTDPDHADYARLWMLVNRKARGRYDRYQSQTDRPIELVRLRIHSEPRGK